MHWAGRTFARAWPAGGPPAGPRRGGRAGRARHAIGRAGSAPAAAIRPIAPVGERKHRVASAPHVRGPHAEPYSRGAMPVFPDPARPVRLTGAGCPGVPFTLERAMPRLIA